MKQKQDRYGKLSRRKLLKYGLYGGLAGGLYLSGCRRWRPGERSNVVIISIDTLRADHLGCYGHKHQTSPNIDRMASQGCRFSNAYTTIPTTLPAHTSLLTSLYPKQFSVHRNGQKLSAEVTTLAEILHSSGYSTAGFVSSAVLNARYGLSKGFGTYDDDVEDEIAMRTAPETLVKAAKWLGRNKQDPFFMFMHLFEPHAPYYAPEFFCERFKVPYEPLPPRWAVEFGAEKDKLSTELIQTSIKAYDAEVACADWAVGELLAELQRLGLDEKTLVILVSDHGETLDELIERFGYGFDHGEFLYTHQLQIPMIIRPPSMTPNQAGKVCPSPVSIVDVMPTVLELLGIDRPAQMAGRSVVDLLEGAQRQQLIFSQRRGFKNTSKPYLAGPAYSVIENQWHLISSAAGGNELYNLNDDPAELRNLYGKHDSSKAMMSKLYCQLDRLEPMFAAEADTDEKAIEQLRSLGYVE